MADLGLCLSSRGPAAAGCSLPAERAAWSIAELMIISGGARQPDSTWHWFAGGGGRVRDTEDGSSLRSALRSIALRGRQTFFITPQQDILVVSVLARGRRRAIQAIVVAHGGEGSS